MGRLCKIIFVLQDKNEDSDRKRHKSQEESVSKIHVIIPTSYIGLDKQKFSA